MKVAEHYFSKEPKSVLELKKIIISINLELMQFYTSNSVFSPDKIDKGTEKLINHLILPQDSLFQEKKVQILDVGAGYGPISIWIEKHLKGKLTSSVRENFQIHSSEVNSRAAWLLNRNIILNKCTNIEIMKGDFTTSYNRFKKREITFDAVYSNPPLKIGHKKMMEIFNKIIDLLSPIGFVQYVHKKRLGAEGFLDKLKDIHSNLYFNLVEKTGGFNIYLISKQKF